MSEYLSIIAQITELQKRADSLLLIEKQAAIEQINRLIANFSIHSDEITFAESNRHNAKSQVSLTSKQTRKVSPKYRDATGNTWTGRGKRPKWLENALKTGSTLDSLRIVSPADVN